MLYDCNTVEPIGTIEVLESIEFILMYNFLLFSTKNNGILQPHFC